MVTFHSVLITASIAAALAWGGLSLHVLYVQRKRLATDRVLSAVAHALERSGTVPLPASVCLERVRPIVASASRDLVIRGAADPATGDNAFAALLAVFDERWGLEGLVADAAQHRSSREKWRRAASLRVLFRMNHHQALPLLARACGEPDSEIAALAFALLGRSSDPKAMDILFDGLRRYRHRASRIAIHIEQSPQAIPGRLKALLDDADPSLRFWGATLLARYPDEDVERDLAHLTSDADPRVRKAAIQTLGKTGHELAAERAAALLTDPYPYVRAHAARALGELGRSDLADRVALLLGDADWWARLAARESLEMMGSDVWPVLMRSLNHADRFVRNGAAEVCQNVGVLDSLVVMEAASDSPGRSKIDILRRIAAAGGVRFTDSLVERAGPIVGPRIRNLLTTIGLEHVGAA
jgi:HEAT repeat protein